MADTKAVVLPDVTHNSQSVLVGHSLYDQSAQKSE